MSDSPFNNITKILKEQCECTVNITEESRLIEDLELESIALLTLITELENHYQAIFEMTEESQMKTIGDIVEYIQTQMNEHG